MLRKEIIDPSIQVSKRQGIDIEAIAKIKITSEDSDHPVENVFDGTSGQGTSYWQAAGPGEQTIIIEFDAPQTIQRVILEIEEKEVSRNQQLRLLVSQDEGRSYEEVVCQGFNFSPPGTTFEKEKWEIGRNEITNIQIWIQPDLEGKECPGKLTSLVLE